MGEKELYKHVERFLQTRLRCFHTERDIGLGVNGVSGRMDVVGLRHVGGHLRGDIEIIGCEVKQGGQRFLWHAGQAAAYGIMAHRCYLIQTEPFNTTQRRVAEHLRIGLATISGQERIQVKEIESAPLVPTVTAFSEELVEHMGYTRCSLCSGYYQIGTERNRLHDRDLVMRDDSPKASLRAAAQDDKHFLYWLTEAWMIQTDERAEKLRSRDGYFNRRYLCSSCATILSGS